MSLLSAFSLVLHEQGVWLAFHDRMLAHWSWSCWTASCSDNDRNQFTEVKARHWGRLRFGFATCWRLVAESGLPDQSNAEMA